MNFDFLHSLSLYYKSEGLPDTDKDVCAILQQAHWLTPFEQFDILPPGLSLDYIELGATIDSWQQAHSHVLV